MFVFTQQVNCVFFAFFGESFLILLTESIDKVRKSVEKSGFTLQNSEEQLFSSAQDDVCS